MELRQLRAVIAIAETGSVTKAAELLHVVQPAISRQLRLLEKELGKPLFERVHNGMTLTPEGQILVQHARRALLSLDQAAAEIRPARGVVAGLVTVGLLFSTCDLVAGDLVNAVSKAFPQIRLRLSTGFAGQLQQWLEDGTIDLAVLYDPKPHAAVEIKPLLDEPFFLVGLRTLGMKWRESEPLTTLRDLPLILPSGTHSVRGILQHACALQDIPLTVVAEADDSPLTRALLMAGVGCTVLAGIAIADELLQKHVVAVPLGKPPLQRRVVLASSVMRQGSPPVRCVADILFERIQTFVREERWPGAKLVEF